MTRSLPLAGGALFAWALAAPTTPRPSQVDFVHEVGPLFKAHCVNCHGGAHPAAGLDLSSAASTRKSGVLAELAPRLLGKGGARMPLNAAPLNSADIETVKAWVAGGAVELGKGRSATHWAYAAPVAPAIPRFPDNAWVRNPIDAFVLRRLNARHLHPSPEADRPTLIRRLSLDLIGLPPTPKEVETFLADRAPNAYEKVVDRLLASPHFGERMALPWLDAARYADSNGFQMDGDNFQYVWRDWVVRAFNANMPFDRFTIEQLAGDLLPNPTLDQKVATAFNRNHMLNGEGGAIPEEQRAVILFDRVDTTSTTWLGVTMACARCHDHKYDPFTQRDYYSLMAYFNQVPETGTVATSGHYDIADPWVYAGTTAQLASLTELQASLKTSPTGPNHDALQKKMANLQADIPRVMVMSDAKPRETHIFSRGNYLAPADKVTPATPALFHRLPGAPSNRLGLARWLVSAQNPLTARVQVNRLWQQFFGVGLVKTSENFGVQTEPPIYLDLLDWLAVRFSRDWDIKALVRTIVMSSTYRQSSQRSPGLAKVDPENALLARGARFRLPSMLLRDEALAASGLLNPAVGGKPVYPYQSPGIWDSLDITDERSFKYPQSHGPDLYRRSLYTFWRRTISPGNMFDAATRQTCTVHQSTTSTPLHALTTLNDVTWCEAARALAQRAIQQGTSVDERLRFAFESVCARRPTASELKVLERILSESAHAFQADPAAATAFLSQGESPRDTRLDPVWHAAYASVCLAIFNLDEALSRE